ncbi:MAG TPA: alkaline phosphatase family protein [Thermoanaerobaculia bacterium]|nr:alkaline phosphatase family protein [Thermoanaerobaculia bacterium]
MSKSLLFKQMLILLALAGAVVAVASRLPLHAQGERPRVIVLGFDGVDARYTEQWMREGKLPNLARLAEKGTYRPLRPTIPAQTPVSWSTFSTGIDPGRTGIFDFLKRDPKTYLPIFAAFEETTVPLLFGERNKLVASAIALLLSFGVLFLLLRLIRRTPRTALAIAMVPAILAGVLAWWWTARYIPITRPGVVNHRQGIPMWDVVSRAGLKAQVIHVPVTFPATDLDGGGHMLSGLGVPDISGRIGKPFYFTSELDFRPGGSSNEFSIEVVQLEDNRGVIQTEIVGPPNKLFKYPPYIRIPMTLTVPEDRSALQVEVGGQRFSLTPGSWSDWTMFDFELNRVISVHGTSRFYLMELTPEIKLYLSPINFDPRRLPPGLKISTPSGWARDLAREYGLYKTMGWAIDTWAISEGFANEQMFWDDMNWTVDQFRTMFRGFLSSRDDLLIQCFEFPDRVGHVFWRFVDPQHPAYDAELAAKWSDGLLRSYQIMDQIVGEAMQEADRHGAALIVMSDHGFSTWRKSINYNTWLVQNGYLGLRAGVEAKERTLEILFDQGQFWENVDWSRTRAYAMGLGNVYINLKGREAQGIVEPGAEYDRLKQELKERLEAIVDPETGERPVSRVFTREEAYRSFDPNLIPDLFVTNNLGYRVSWQTSLGGIQKELFEINERVWSGDHCSLDPELVKGIFFYNRKLATDREPYIADIYPTVLDLLGLAPPYELDGETLK